MELSPQQKADAAAIAAIGPRLQLAPACKPETQFPAQPERMSAEDSRFTEREVGQMQLKEAAAWGFL